MYDLVDDPGERCNLWNDRPEIVERLEWRLQQIRNDPGSRFWRRGYPVGCASDSV